jgi:hypothetical protein
LVKLQNQELLFYVAIVSQVSDLIS